MFINRDPRSQDPSAKPHGRIDMALTCCRVLLALGAALTTSGHLSTAAYCGLVCVIAAVQLLTLVSYQPLHSAHWNCYNGAFAAQFGWAAAMTLLGSLRDEPENQVLHHDVLHYFKL